MIICVKFLAQAYPNWTQSILADINNKSVHEQMNMKNITKEYRTAWFS